MRASMRSLIAAVYVVNYLPILEARRTLQSMPTSKSASSTARVGNRGVEGGSYMYIGIGGLVLLLILLYVLLG